MTRHILRWEVPTDDEAHAYGLSSNPRKVAVGVHWHLGVHTVSFWVEDDDDAPRVERYFRVFATGQGLPDGARHWGTTERTPEGLVWHLYEVVQ